MTFKSSSSGKSKPKAIKRISPKGKTKKAGATVKADPREIMVVLKSMGIPSPSRDMVLDLTGYAAGSFSNWLSKYKGMGQVEFDGKNCSITPKGEAEVGITMSPIQSNAEMHERIKKLYKVQGMALKVFDILLGSGAVGCDKAKLMQMVNCTNNGTFTNILSKLRKPGLVEGKNMIRCTDFCFPIAVGGRPSSGGMSRGAVHDL